MFLSRHTSPKQYTIQTATLPFSTPSRLTFLWPGLYNTIAFCGRKIVVEIFSLFLFLNKFYQVTTVINDIFKSGLTLSNKPKGT